MKKKLIVGLSLAALVLLGVGAAWSGSVSTLLGNKGSMPADQFATTSAGDCCAKNEACCDIAEDCCPVLGDEVTAKKDCCPASDCCPSEACCAPLSSQTAVKKDCCPAGDCCPSGACCPLCPPCPFCP